MALWSGTSWIQWIYLHPSSAPASSRTALPPYSSLYSLIPAPRLLALHRHRRRARQDQGRYAALADVVHRRAEPLRATLDVDEHGGGPPGDLGEARRRGQRVHLVGRRDDVQRPGLLGREGRDEGWVVGAQVDEEVGDAGGLERVEDGGCARDALGFAHAG
ncbi:hypothetical protein S7711_10845 [Stachybotrys chartarum IBT 7711]|uniref:Uncharacterized protein n=1 Tax=Stachybotrys chartarum (strain CBS 109288 / IBT 7711) TaxID=1280523 RepID=A0A084B5M8_STACB|nr:hypothetical protein S7711_10845 [Stachybotrys chartarum IBT 7711]KFA53369.1 hypothetical protein S40293_11104 [Stachybotrys chartarum IBT 40293]